MAVRGDNSLFFATGLDNSGLQSGANDAAGIIQNLAGVVAGISPFAILATGALTAFGTITNAAYNMMREFEQAMKEVETISEAAQKDFAGISSQVFALSEISPDTPVKLAQAYYQIVSAGYDGAEGMKLLETATKAATAGVTDTQTAADGITTVLNAFKISAEEADRVADVMFNTVKLGKTTFEELSRSLSEVAPLAAASGFSFEEVSGAVATLTKQGIPTSQAMTQIRSAIEATTEVLGDGAAKSMSLQNAFQAIYDKAGGSQNELKKLTGRMEAMNAILAITGPNAEGAAADLAAMSNAAGSAEEAFGRMTESNVNQWQILRNRIKATTEELGNSAVEMSSLFARSVNSMFDESESFTSSIRRQANEFNSLKLALENSNTPFEEKLEILTKLKDQYPEYLRSLDLDKISNDNLEKTLLNVRDALRQINDEQERRLKTSGAQQNLTEAENRAAEELGNFERVTNDFFRIIEEVQDYAAKNDVELNIDFTKDPQEIANDVFFAFNQQDVSLIGKGGELRAVLQETAGYVDEYKTRWQEASDEVDSTTKRLQDVKRATYDNAEGAKAIVAEIKSINTLSELNPFQNWQFPDIQDALKQRQTILAQFASIDAIQDIDTLKPFLESETKAVKEYAEERKRILNKEAPNVVPSGEEEKYSDYLKEIREKYKTHQAVLNQIGEEAANKQFESLLSQGENYGEFLKKKLSETTNFAKQQAIAVEAEVNRLDLNRGQATSVNAGITAKPIKLDLDLDQTSINFIERQIAELQEKFNAATTTEERSGIGKQIEIWEERLQIARNGANEEIGIFEKINLRLEDLNYDRLKEYRNYWKERANEAKKFSKEEQEAIAKYTSADQEIGNRFQNRMQDISNGIEKTSDLFRKFGDDVLADNLAKMADLANQFANIGMQVATGNYVGAVIGAVGAIGSMLSGNDGESAFQKQMDSLSRSIDLLSSSLERLYGAEALAARNEILDSYREQRTLLEEQREAYEELLNQTSGGFIDSALRELTQENLATIEEELEEIESGIYQMTEDLRNSITGTTEDSIADSIINGFREGKRGIEDFAQTFEDMMQTALLQTFENNFLRDKLQDFYTNFADLGEEGEGFSPEDIEQLRTGFNDIITGAQGEIDALNQVLEGAGFDPLGGTANRPQGMSGAIQNITEDTANILEGYMNAIRLDVRQGIVIAEQSSLYLSQISVNTRSMDNTLKSLDNRMATIENGILDFQSRG